MAKMHLVNDKTGDRKEGTGGRAAMRGGGGVRRKSLPGGPPPKSLGVAGEVASCVLLYRRWIGDLGKQIAEYDAEDRDGFFHLMKMMYMLGLRAEDVITQLRFTPETIARWINGSRTPHVEMRAYVLEKCYAILRQIAELPVPRELVRLGD